MQRSERWIARDGSRLTRGSGGWVRPLALILVLAGGSAIATSAASVSVRLPAPLAPDAPAVPELLVLGDGKISASPEKGFVFSCQQRYDPNAPGATRTGPWILGERWNPGAKVTVHGNVDWPQSSVKVLREGDRRVVVTNNLPEHGTGIFPVSPADDAYLYDRNPHAIERQAVVLALPAVPHRADTPSCLPMGIVGVALSGAAIFSALDQRGLDAPAYEIQDACQGHPEENGQYHYHGWSSCLADPDGAAGRHSSLAGYALDGFGIYGPRDRGGVELSSDDLDACHGHIGPARRDGRWTTTYHYHFTADYPHTVGCFAGTPVAVAGPAAPAVCQPPLPGPTPPSPPNTSCPAPTGPRPASAGTP